jgi:uncharacterized protein YdcH (DUF465 family)
MSAPASNKVENTEIKSSSRDTGKQRRLQRNEKLKRQVENEIKDIEQRDQDLQAEMIKTMKAQRLQCVITSISLLKDILTVEEYTRLQKRNLMQFEGMSTTSSISTSSSSAIGSSASNSNVISSNDAFTQQINVPALLNAKLNTAASSAQENPAKRRHR